MLRQLANPNLHDIPLNLPFRVEMWDQSDQHIRWVIAASASVAVGHAAMDAAIANYPDQRFTLRNGILVLGSMRELRRPSPAKILSSPQTGDAPNGQERQPHTISHPKAIVTKSITSATIASTLSDGRSLSHCSLAFDAHFSYWS